MDSIETFEILGQVRFLLAHHLCLTPEEVTASATIEDDLGIDSLDFAELFIALEDTFGIAINPVDACRFYTVSDIADFLSDRVREPAQLQPRHVGQEAVARQSRPGNGVIVFVDGLLRSAMLAVQRYHPLGRPRHARDNGSDRGLVHDPA
jgi:acyl carrier protein